jgi:hypothetical protein
MIYGYGEDSLTLWALKNKFQEICNQLNEPGIDKHIIFYRPSFGRGKTGLGEPDFIIGTPKRLYIGESKWPLGIKKNSKGKMLLRIKNPIKKRNLIGKYLIGRMLSKDWETFKTTHLNRKGTSLLAKNISAYADELSKIVTDPRTIEVVPILLVFCDPQNNSNDSLKAQLEEEARDFSIITIKPEFAVSNLSRL